MQLLTHTHMIKSGKMLEKLWGKVVSTVGSYIILVEKKFFFIKNIAFLFAGHFSFLILM